ncbi:MAG TPA: hypothetical protein VKE91_02640, partial [Blastocatellia bacterium]|nr:hypothetical protein [Blastocatellia bacterium]
MDFNEKKRNGFISAVTGAVLGTRRFRRQSRREAPIASLCASGHDCALEATHTQGAHHDLCM